MDPRCLSVCKPILKNWLLFFLLLGLQRFHILSHTYPHTELNRQPFLANKRGVWRCSFSDGSQMHSPRGGTSEHRWALIGWFYKTFPLLVPAPFSSFEKFILLLLKQARHLNLQRFRLISWVPKQMIPKKVCFLFIFLPRRFFFLKKVAFQSCFWQQMMNRGFYLL